MVCWIIGLFCKRDVVICLTNTLVSKKTKVIRVKACPCVCRQRSFQENSVSRWICIRIFMKMYAYICVHVYVHVYVYVCIYIYTYVHIHIYTYIYIYTYVHIHIYTYIYIYTYVHIHIYTYIYIYHNLLLLLTFSTNELIMTGLICAKWSVWSTRNDTRNDYALIMGSFAGNDPIVRPLSWLFSTFEPIAIGLICGEWEV